jgi:hypothetical protein
MSISIDGRVNSVVAMYNHRYGKSLNRTYFMNSQTVIE